MPVQHLPHQLATAVADFVEDRARSAHLPTDLGEAYERACWEVLVHHYRQAVRSANTALADRYAHELLTIAVQHQDHPHFLPAWQHAHEVITALEGGDA